MKLRYGPAIVIFISSYAPLGIMLVLLDFNFEKWWPNHPSATWAAFGIAFLSCVVLVIVMQTLKGEFVVQVTQTRDRSNELLNYSLPYVASFYGGGGIANPNFVAALCFFLFLIGLVSIRTQTVLINPLLALAGYGLYEVNFTDGAASYERIVLSKTQPKAGEPFKLAPLTQFLSYGEEAFE